MLPNFGITEYKEYREQINESIDKALSKQYSIKTRLNSICRFKVTRKLDDFFTFFGSTKKEGKKTR